MHNNKTGVLQCKSRNWARVRGVNRVRDRGRIRAGGERVVLFEKYPPFSPQKNKWKNH